MERDNVSDRLETLIPWLDGDPMTDVEALDRVARFLDGCTSAWLADADGEMPWLCDEDGFTTGQVDRLRRDLRRVLVDAIGGGPPTTFPLNSLRFGVVKARARPEPLPADNAERRLILGPGHYRTVVWGDLRDLALYALMRTLTEPGASEISRCPAPAPGDWSSECGRFVVTAVGPGRPKRYCSSKCRLRTHKAREAEQYKTEETE